MDQKILDIMNELREFMFKNVYLREETMQQRSDAKRIVEVLVEYFKNNPDKLPSSYSQEQSKLIIIYNLKKLKVYMVEDSGIEPLTS